MPAQHNQQINKLVDLSNFSSRTHQLIIETSMSSSEDERGLGTDLKAISSGERTLALSLFNYGTEKVKQL